MNAIEIRNVTKAFGSRTAVRALSLAVPEGSIYGFIGPNGSGKTTTIRMVLNILVPDAGSIEVLGRPSQSAIRDAIGYLPEERGLYKRMTVRQVLRYYGQLKGKPLSELDPSINSWLARFNLAESASARVLTLSKGMSQKVQFIATVITHPRLLILDEPFSGLDPVNANALRDAILDLRRQGTTLVFSTHDMSAAERLCDRILMIFQGRKVLDGSLADIQAEHGQDTVRVRSAGGAAVLAGMRDEVESFVDAGNYQDVRLRTDPQRFLSRLVASTAVTHFEVTRPSLHDIFVSIAGPASAESTSTELSS